MIASGKLRNLIRLESEIITRDNIGGVVRSWALVVETWARVKSISGTESDKAGKPTYESLLEFVIRPQEMAINELMRLVFQGENYRVQSIDRGWFNGKMVRLVASVDR